MTSNPPTDPARKLTTDVFTTDGQRTWRVTGPAGVAQYQTATRQLTIEPVGMSAEKITDIAADEAAQVAVDGSDKTMFVLLTAHYRIMAERYAGLPTSIAQWRELRGAALNTAILAADWYAWPDDTIGGWAVMPVNVPPSSGAPTVGTFLSEQIARHIAQLHNRDLDDQRRLAEHAELAEKLRAETRARLAPVKDVIQAGDVVFIPKGADPLYDINRRIRVDEISTYGVSGSRLKPTGEPIKSYSSTAADKHGNQWAVLKWTELLKCTITRDGATVYQPEGNQ